MSKARPHAHIYEKWVRGIRAAVPSAEERCGLYEYIIAYQIAKVYEAAELPRVQDLSSAAAVALAMLEGDLEELCEARRDNNDKRRENGAQATPASPGQTLPGSSSPGQTLNNTIQSNTIQSNTKQDAPALAYTGEEMSEFDLGLALLRCGYIIKAERLRSVYESAKGKKSPLAYAKGCYKDEATNPNKSSIAIIANFIEQTKCRHTYALEIYSIQKEGEELAINCAQRALDTITPERMQAAARTYGAKAVQVYCSGHEPYKFSCNE